MTPISCYIIPAGPDAARVLALATAVKNGVGIIGTDALATAHPFHVGTLPAVTRTVRDTRKGARDGDTREQVTTAESRAWGWIARHLKGAADVNVRAAYGADAGSGGMLLAARKRAASTAARNALASGHGVTVALASGDVIVASSGDLPSAGSVAGALATARKGTRSRVGATYARALASASGAPETLALPAGE